MNGSRFTLETRNEIDDDSTNVVVMKMRRAVMHSEWFLLERGGPSREWEAGHPEICGPAALGKIQVQVTLRSTRTLHSDSSRSIKILSVF